MPYQIPIPKREDWQKLRDGNKVPKGAAKVSVGDAIAAVYKSFSIKSVDQNLTDTEKLIQVLTSYMASIKAKYPNFEPIVNDKVKKKASSHLTFMKDIKKAKVEYYPRFSAVDAAWKQLKLFNKGKPKDIANALMRFKGVVDAFALIDPAWEKKRPAVQTLFQRMDSTATITEQDKASMEKFLKDMKA